MLAKLIFWLGFYEVQFLVLSWDYRAQYNDMVAIFLN